MQGTSASPDAGGFTGVVLCGGASARMGTDKALLEVDGVPMARRAADALVAAGAGEVLAIGGAAASLARLGLTPYPDERPGEGPLPATMTALASAGGDLVMVLSCDLLYPSEEAVRTVVAALIDHPDALLAVPLVGGHRQWTHAAWRRGALPLLTSGFDAGLRSLRRAGAAVPLVEVTTLDPRWILDADLPADLP